MYYHNIDAHNPGPREKRAKRLLGAWLLFGALLAGAGAYATLRPAPPHRVYGYIVAKEWTKAHMSDKEPQRVQQASLLGVVFVPGAHTVRPVPSQFTVWVANRAALRPVLVDSATWFTLRCGQRYAYYYRPGWL